MVLCGGGREPSCEEGLVPWRRYLEETVWDVAREEREGKGFGRRLKMEKRMEKGGRDAVFVVWVVVFEVFCKGWVNSET